MEIVIGRTTSAKRDGARNSNPSRNGIRRRKVDRRKNKQDRRKSVRDGVYVTLSTKNDRRVHRDRRRNQGDSHTT